MAIIDWKQGLLCDKCMSDLINIINSSPYDTILDWSESKALADDKMKLAKIMIFAFGSIESIVGKGENAGHQHFLLFP